MKNVPRRLPNTLAHMAVLVLLAAAAPMVQAQAKLAVAPKLTVVEGDTAGTTAATLQYSLDQPAVTDVGFDVTLEYTSTATRDADFITFAPTRLSIPPGQSAASFTVQILGDTRTEEEEWFRVTVSQLTGASLQDVATTEVTIDDDDVLDATDWHVVDDTFDVVARGGREAGLPLAANDLGYQTLPVEIIEGPEHGRVEWTYQSMVSYVVPENFIGIDRFRYRLCVESVCKEGSAVVRVLPFVDESFNEMPPPGYGGITPTALTTTPLAKRSHYYLPLPVDRFPQDRWDAGGDNAITGTFPAWVEGQPREHVLVVEHAYDANNGRVAVGIDDDGNGMLSAGEARCEGVRHCVVTHSLGDTPTTWIVRGYNPSDVPTESLVYVYDVPAAPSDGSFAVTGPGRAAAGWAGSTFRIDVNDPELLNDNNFVKAGIARARASDGTSFVDIPVVFRGVGHDLPLPLTNGRPLTFPLGIYSPERVFIDVPAGVQGLRFRVATDSPVGTPFSVFRPSSSSAQTGTDIAIPASPGSDLPAANATATGGAGKEVVIPSVLLAPGRWYVVPAHSYNHDVRFANITVTATIDAVAPVVRDGSYYNPARPGSGVFLYPAGDQWTGLWYTYFAEGRPTWYYLQGSAPDADGIRYSEVWRATWNGQTRSLTSVGDVTLTPTAADAFTMTYRIDGATGSQPMQALGRGCPAGDGGAVDISSTWFDPAKTGTGYSVQTWDDYEYHAAFVYDPQGVPLFLAAELDHFGGDEAILDLQRLTGSCPTCFFQPSVRTDVGTYVRRLAGNTLQAVEVDAVWSDELADYSIAPGAWTAVDTVQPLGGPGTTQGCAP